MWPLRPTEARCRSSRACLAQFWNSTGSRCGPPHTFGETNRRLLASRGVRGARSSRAAVVASMRAIGGLNLAAARQRQAAARVTSGARVVLEGDVAASTRGEDVPSAGSCLRRARLRDPTPLSATRAARATGARRILARGRSRRAVRQRPPTSYGDDAVAVLSRRSNATSLLARDGSGERRHLCQPTPRLYRTSRRPTTTTELPRSGLVQPAEREHIAGFAAQGPQVAPWRSVLHVP